MITELILLVVFVGWKSWKSAWILEKWQLLLPYIQWPWRSYSSVADAGEIMPPKSTWFEPKLRSGLFVHEL